jgi:hypothetical protein
MPKILFVALLLAICPLLVAQQQINNEIVVKMVKAGLGDDVIIATISTSQGTYDTSANGLIALKQAGVSDKVISALVLKVSGSTQPSAPVQGPTVPKNEEMPSSAAGPVSSEAAEPSDPGTVTASGKIPAGARIVIAPMGGFETYFAAAVREKKVPITLTLDKVSAQYFVVSTNTEWQGFVYGSGGSASWSQNGGSAAHASAASSTRGLEASIMVIDAKTKDVIWAYEVHKSSHGSLLFGTLGARGQQSVAEACAKHLKEYIEKGK